VLKQGNEIKEEGDIWTMRNILVKGVKILTTHSMTFLTYSSYGRRTIEKVRESIGLVVIVRSSGRGTIEKVLESGSGLARALGR